MAEIKDYYGVLGIGEKATKADIKKVYRKLAREYHPDRNQGKPDAEEKFKEIQEAYEVLSNDEKRQKYDRLRKNPFGGDFQGSFGGPSGDPFSEMFASRGGGRFYQAPDGTYVRVEQNDPRRSGSESGSPLGGLGEMFSQFFRSAEPDEPTGRRLDRKRSIRITFKRMLEGGRIRIDLDGKKFQVPFPKGVRDGYRVRVRGQGAPGSGGQRGDLYVTFRVADHSDFIREGNDVHANVNVPALEAILGTEKDVVDPYGKKIRLHLRAGIQPGEILRVRGHGIETEREKGNLLVHVALTVPDNLTEEQRATIERAAREAGLL